MAGVLGEPLRRALLDLCDTPNMSVADYTRKNHCLALYALTLVASAGTDLPADSAAELLWADHFFVDVVVNSTQMSQPIDVQEQALRLVLTMTQCRRMHAPLWFEEGMRVAMLCAAADPNAFLAKDLI